MWGKLTAEDEMSFLSFKVLDESNLLDQWSTSIQDGHGFEQAIYRATEIFIRESRAPGIKIEHQAVAPSFLDGLFGGRHDFMVITNTATPNLRTFVVFIHASSYGTTLSVNWFLCTRLGLVETLIEKARYGLSGDEPPTPLTAPVNLFEKHIELRGFATTAYTGLLQAVEQIMGWLGQDVARIDPWRGFLNADTTRSGEP